MHALRTLFVISALTLASCATAPTAAKADPSAAEAALRQRVDSLLYRYANNDQPGVLAMLDPQRLLILGSNLNEVVHTPDELRAFMSRDFAQWQSAKFTNVRDVDMRTDGALATAYLVFDFSAPGGPTVPIRFCSTWRKVNGEWLLTQSSSVAMMGQ
jgi:hypothetical protein